MGRLIDVDELLKYGACPNDCKGTPICMKGDYEHLHCPIRVFDIESINDAPTVEAIPKADYENRLNADMVAMLIDIQLEIEEKEQHYQDKFIESKNAVHDDAMGGRMFGCGECKEIIQQKIDALKAESEE